MNAGSTNTRGLLIYSEYHIYKKTHKSLASPSLSIIDTKNKALINLLHAQNYCISYNCTLLLETAIAKKTQKFDGIHKYHHSFKRCICFLCYDFAEDTVDGKSKCMVQSQQCIKRLVSKENC